MAGECPLPCTPAWSDAKMHINDGDGSVAMLSRRHHLFCCRDMSASMFHDMFHSSTRLLSSRRSSRQLGR